MAESLPLPNESLFISNLTVNILIGGGGGSGTIGNPTDGVFGIANVAGVLPTDTHADALDKVQTLVETLSTIAPPGGLDGFTLSLVDATYSAFLNGTDTLRTNVQNNVNQKPTTAIIGPFAGAESGVLTAYVKNSGAAESAQGAITLTAADDTGIDNYLEITADEDPFAGIPGQEGVFKALDARIGGTGAGTVFLPAGDEEYSFRMEHVDVATASTPALLFRQDDAYTTAPSVDIGLPSLGITAVNIGGGSYVSGVPILTTSDSLTIKMRANNCVKLFYNSTWTARVSAAEIVTQTQLPTGSDRNLGSNPIFTFTAGISGNTYNENVIITSEARNSAGTTAGANTFALNPVRVDTVSINPDDTPTGFVNEADSGTVRRRPSGTGNFGTGFSDTAYPQSQSLASNEELQLLGGLYQYPPAYDYSTTLPAGPDYTSLPLGSYASHRWVTFAVGTVDDDVNFTVTINGAVNFGGDKIISGFKMYARVDGATPTTGWISGNDAYVGLGNPSADDDPALDFANSTVTSRRITFGLAPKTGDLFVRIGLPSGSNKGFIGVSRV